MMDAHAHTSVEQHYVLEGQYKIEGRKYGPSTYQMIPARHTHGPFTSLSSTRIRKYRKNLLTGIQNRIIESIKEAVQFNNIAVEDISWFIPHQANLRMFQSMAKTLKIPFEKFYVTLHKYGNISSASCAIAFDEAVRDGSIKKNDLICLPVFGGGLTWGSSLIRW